MSNNSSRIVISNILTPLANDVEGERRLIKAGESFDQRHKDTIEHDRDELRRSGIVAADWTPNETNADHGYWDVWSERLRKVARDLEAAGETVIAGRLLTFCRQIDGRDEVTCESDFRFEKLAEWLAAVMDGDKKDDDGPWSTPDSPAEWAKKYGFSTDTLMRRFTEGKIRYIKLSTKSYRIHVDDVPK